MPQCLVCRKETSSTFVCGECVGKGVDYFRHLFTTNPGLGKARIEMPSFRKLAVVYPLSDEKMQELLRKKQEALLQVELDKLDAMMAAVIVHVDESSPLKALHNKNATYEAVKKKFKELQEAHHRMDSVPAIQKCSMKNPCAEIALPEGGKCNLGYNCLVCRERMVFSKHEICKWCLKQAPFKRERTPRYFVVGYFHNGVFYCKDCSNSGDLRVAAENLDIYSQHCGCCGKVVYCGAQGIVLYNN